LLLLPCPPLLRPRLIPRQRLICRLLLRLLLLCRTLCTRLLRCDARIVSRRRIHRIAE